MSGRWWVEEEQRMPTGGRKSSQWTKPANRYTRAGGETGGATPNFSSLMAKLPRQEMGCIIPPYEIEVVSSQPFPTGKSHCYPSTHYPSSKNNTKEKIKKAAMHLMWPQLQRRSCIWCDRNYLIKSFATAPTYFKKWPTNFVNRTQITLINNLL